MPDRLRNALDDNKRFHVIVSSLVAAEKKADERYDALAGAVKAAAERAAAAEAAAAAVRKDLSGKLDSLGANVSKLASARLLQQAFTSLVLAGGLTVLIQAIIR